MDAEVADGFAAHVHNDVERAGKAIPYSALFPDGAGRGTYVEFLQTCPFPARHFVKRLYSRIMYVCQDFQMSNNPSLFLHMSTSFLVCTYSKSDTYWKCPLHMVCTLSKSDVAGALVYVPSCGFSQAQQIGVSQTFCIYCACSDHLCNTCTTGLVMLWGFDTMHTLHSSWWCISV